MSKGGVHHHDLAEMETAAGDQKTH